MTFIILDLLRNAFSAPPTNEFPARHTPKSIAGFLAAVGRGEAELIPPVEMPPNARGRIAYDWEACTGCRQCIIVCPAKAITFEKERKKIHIDVASCIWCGQCNDICPVDVLSMSDEFMLAVADKTDASMHVGPPDDWVPPEKPARKKKAA